MINETTYGLPVAKTQRVQISTWALSEYERLRTATKTQRVQIITERLILLSLILYALFAPHSIAITQGAFLLGLTAWAVQMAVNRKNPLQRTPVDIALLGFFACCVVSSFLSYDPLVSVKGLRSPAFFLAFYFVSNKVRSVGFALFLAFLIVLSCLANVVASGVQLGIGHGLRIDSIRDDSPFANRGLAVSDIILAADDQPVNSLGDLSRIIDADRGPLRIKFQRSEAVSETLVSRRLEGSGTERLGLAISPGRNFRVMGFYSHYETYAEVLQLIAALAVGLLIALPNKRSWKAYFLGAMIGLIAVTLILTSTRAPMAGLILAVIVMAIASARRRALLIVALSVIIMAPLAYVMIERSRGIAVIDPGEGSTAYRLEIWREAFGLIRDHPLVGIGKGSEGKLKDSLGLYDDGKLPPGHFHSTPIQIATWWGLPALILYCSFMAIFAVEMWRLARRLRAEQRWDLWGIALGGLGALVAFNISSLAHFNFGDGEVVMMFWLLTGLAFAVRHIAAETHEPMQSEPRLEPPAIKHSPQNQPLQPAAIAEPNVRAAKARPN